MTRAFRFAAGMALAGAMLAGCAQTQQIETSPPRPAVAVPDSAVTTPRSRLAVVLETGATSLPGEVARLRFEVAELLVKPRGGAWTVYPTTTGHIEIAEDQSGRPRRTLLNTQVPAVPYDSLALRLDDVYVTFGPDAGAPLSLPRDPIAYRLALDPAPDRLATVRLVLEPGASLVQTPDCRWVFAPFVQVTTE